VRPLPTYYHDTAMRSRLEARWAVFFDALGIPWEYEPQGFRLDHGCYLADFRLWGVLYAEIKPPPSADTTTAFYAQLVRRTAGMHRLLILVDQPRVMWYRVICAEPPALRWIDLETCSRRGHPLIIEAAHRPGTEDLAWPHLRFERACMDAAFHRFGRVV